MDEMLTLTQAAEVTGYSREAIRLRVRRGKLRSIKGNDGITRVYRTDLSDLPPQDDPQDDHPDNHGPSVEEIIAAATGDLRTTVDDLRVQRDRLQAALDRVQAERDRVQADRLVDHGRAAAAEAQAAAETARAERAEALLAEVMARQQEEARTREQQAAKPWRPFRRR